MSWQRVCRCFPAARRSFSTLPITRMQHECSRMAWAIWVFYQNTLAVFSMLKDKDVRGVIDAVKHRFDAWYLGGIEALAAASVDWLEAQITELTPQALRCTHLAAWALPIGVRGKLRVKMIESSCLDPFTPWPEALRARERQR